MKKLFAMAIAAVGTLAAGAASMGCLLMILDEPEAPKSIIEK